MPISWVAQQVAFLRFTQRTRRPAASTVVAAPETGLPKIFQCLDVPRGKTLPFPSGNLRNLAKRADTLFENKRTRGLIAKPVKKCFEAAIPPKAVREIFVDDIHGVIEVPEHDGFFRPAPFSVPRVVRWCVEALRIRSEKEASRG